MSLDTILEAAIGTVFLFTLLSIIVSAFTEQIPQWFWQQSSRASYLKKAITSLLGNEALAFRFFGHPIYRSLSENDKANPSYLSKEHFLDIFIDCLGPLGSFGRRGELTSLADLKPYVENSTIDIKVRQLLLSYIGLAGNNVGKFNESVFQWYEGIMERASGWYKKSKQRQAFVVGLCLAIALNIDTGSILGLLLKDDKTRSALVSQATEFYEKNKEVFAEGKAKQDYAAFVKNQAESIYEQMPISILGWTNTAWNTLWYGTSRPPEPPKKEATSPPAGTASTNSTDQPAPENESPHPEAAVLRVLSKLLGFFMTGIAITFGAPFWFDLLGKLVSLRGAGKNPSEKPAGSKGASQ